MLTGEVCYSVMENLSVAAAFYLFICGHGAGEQSYLWQQEPGHGLLQDSGFMILSPNLL